MEISLYLLISLFSRFRGFIYKIISNFLFDTMHSPLATLNWAQSVSVKVKLKLMHAPMHFCSNKGFPVLFF